jgi:anti-sigma-K factor RskA
LKASPEHEHLLELAALRATEGLADDQTRELLSAQHGARIAATLDEAAAAVHLAFLAARAPRSVSSTAARVGAPTPPVGLEERLFNRATAELARELPRPRATPAEKRAQPHLLGWVGWLLAAAAVVLCTVLAARLAELQERARLGAPSVRRDRLVAEAPDAAVLDWTPLTHESAQGLSGRVTWSDARNEGYMTFRGLAPNDPREAQYQLWIFRGTDLAAEPHPVDGGVFDVTAGEEVVVPIDAKLPVGRVGTFVVTVEPPGGVVVSDRSKLVALAQRAL